MSEAKTEAPTPKRRQEMRSKGQVARSQDLGAAAVLLAGIVALRAFGGVLWDEMRATSVDSFGLLSTDELTAAGAMNETKGSMIVVLKLLLPLLAVLPIVAIAVTLAQTGFTLSLEPLTPKLQRIDPLSNARRLFLSWHGLVNLAKSLAKFGLVGVVAFLTLWSRRDEIAGLGRLGLHDGDAAFFGLAFDVAVRSAAVLFALALADYAFQRWQFGRDSRMTRQEVRDELRQTDGDPQTRARLRRQRQSLLARTIARVPQADVIVTNPTSIAVALKYDPVEMRAPTIVAKGQRLMADRIRAVASEHDIPIVENRPLARALFRGVPVGREIPAHLYAAVAEVLAFVYRLRHGGPAWAAQEPPRATGPAAA